MMMSQSKLVIFFLRFLFFSHVFDLLIIFSIYSFDEEGPISLGQANNML